MKPETSTFSPASQEIRPIFSATAIAGTRERHTAARPGTSLYCNNVSALCAPPTISGWPLAAVANLLLALGESCGGVSQSCKVREAFFVHLQWDYQMLGDDDGKKRRKPSPSSQTSKRRLSAPSSWNRWAPPPQTAELSRRQWRAKFLAMPR